MWSVNHCGNTIDGDDDGGIDRTAIDSGREKLTGDHKGQRVIDNTGSKR